MRWTVKKTDGVWYACCAGEEPHEVDSLQDGLDYARDRILGSEATA